MTLKLSVFTFQSIRMKTCKLCLVRIFTCDQPLLLDWWRLLRLRIITGHTARPSHGRYVLREDRWIVGIGGVIGLVGLRITLENDAK